MKRTTSTCTSSSSSSRRKTSESCGASISCDISDRLRMLSLPNSHLVEAVLKQHSHVFTADCRDRLRNLLQVIVNVNSSSRKKFDRLHEKLNSDCIKNLQERIIDIQTESKFQRNQESQYQTEDTNLEEIPGGPRREMTFTYGPNSSSLVCNASTASHEDPLDESQVPKETVTSLLPSFRHTSQNTKITEEIIEDMYADKKVFSKEEFHAIHNKNIEVCRLDLLNEVSNAACGDYDSDMEVLFEKLYNLNKNLKREHEPAEFGDFPLEIDAKEKYVQKTEAKEKPKGKTSPNHKSQIPRCVRVRHLSSVREEEKKPPMERQRRPHSMPRQDAALEGFKLTPIPERRGRRRARGYSKRRIINVPSLAIRAYIALIMDMQSNCALYETFRNDMIRPVEVYKQPYLIAAYDCWMDYMIYMKNTLDYLHPYIMNLVRIYYTRKQNDPELKDYETKLPKVLVNSMKNIKAWRKVLHDSIECVDQLFRGNSKPNIHSLYERYYTKIHGLPKASYSQIGKEEENTQPQAGGKSKL